MEKNYNLDVYPDLIENNTTFYLFPIIILLPLIIYKRFLLGYHDFWLNFFQDLFLASLSIIFSIKRESRFGQILQFVLVFLIILYQWLDTCIILALHQRLTIENFSANYRDFAVISYFVTPTLLIYTGLVLAGLLLTLRLKIVSSFGYNATNFIMYEIIFLILVTLIFLAFMDKEKQEGVFDLSHNSYIDNTLKPELLEQVKEKYPNVVERANAIFKGYPWLIPVSEGPKPDIIFILSESLSNVDSHYSQGLFNRLPMIDQIQQEGLSLTNAVSNGKISNQALGSILLGVIPNKVSGYDSILTEFPPKIFTQNNVIHYANKEGYETIALTGNPSSWQNVSEWMRQIGFNKVYDRDAAFFANAPRYVWDAPNDATLYQAANNLLLKQKSPYFMMIETMSLHEPYILPDKKYKIGGNDLLNQVNYVDATTYAFYQQLKKEGFFDHGILVVVGDHRRFDPLEKEEIKDGGYAKWHERIVAFMVGKNIAQHTLSSTPVSSEDLNTLLHYMVQGKSINTQRITEANIGTRIGAPYPFSISMVDEKNGTYLVRSEKYKPMFISIYGDSPINDIPNQTYEEAAAFLILNDNWVNTLLTSQKKQKP